MTSQHAKELLPIITAYANGETIERRTPDGRWFSDTNYDFSDPPERYRIKPKPATRRWSKPEDVPGPVCWIRRGHCNWDRLIVMVNGSRITCVGGRCSELASFDWSELEAGDFRYSIDRKTWLPCTVTEEQP